MKKLVDVKVVFNFLLIVPSSGFPNRAPSDAPPIDQVGLMQIVKNVSEVARVSRRRIEEQLP